MTAPNQPKHESPSDGRWFVAAFVLLVTGCGGSVVAVQAKGDAGTGSNGTPPSCKALPKSCGPAHDLDCCTSPVVSGGTFYRSYDGAANNDRSFPATVSTLRLDAYEITVGRFRKFVAAYSQDMIPAGTGKNPNNPSDPGWDATWTANLPSDAAALVKAVDCTAAFPTWMDAPGPYENRPMNCITWYEAFAFCIWDGGRLPTESEWNYAAAGGNEQRVYPWGTAAPDCTYANYRGAAGGTDFCALPGIGSTNDVGSESPNGDGKWGHADLAGNLWEWALDSFAMPYSPECVDCANTAEGAARVLRGGTYNGVASFLPTSRRDGSFLVPHSLDHGARCARPE